LTFLLSNRVLILTTVNSRMAFIISFWYSTKPKSLLYRPQIKPSWPKLSVIHILLNIKFIPLLIDWHGIVFLY
jgi:hypothetical protein